MTSVWPLPQPPEAAGVRGLRAGASPLPVGAAVFLVRPVAGASPAVVFLRAGTCLVSWCLVLVWATCGTPVGACLLLRLIVGPAAALDAPRGRPVLLLSCR